MLTLPNYDSTRETTNLARAARIVLGPCTDILRAVLMKEVLPSILIQKVKTYLANIPKHKKPPINQKQEQLVYGGNYTEFDITLLYFLLRNICSIPPHKKQWGNEPDPLDKSVSANIERIRLIRNQYGHTSEITISNKDFNMKCQQIFDIFLELEKYLGTTNVYQNELKKIKTCSMDPDREKQYIEQLLSINETLHELSGKFRLILIHLVLSK